MTIKAHTPSIVIFFLLLKESESTARFTFCWNRKSSIRESVLICVLLLYTEESYTTARE